MDKEVVIQFFTELEDEAREAIRIITDIANQANNFRNKLEAEFKWDTNLDARLTAIGKIINPLNAATLSYISILEYFLNFSEGSLWERVKKTSLPFSTDDLVVHLLSYKQSILFSLFYQVFSGVESSLRIFLRKQSKKFGQLAIGKFQDEFETLLNICGFSKSKSNEYWELLHILSTYRNCVHNNGIYIHEKGGVYTAKYGGKEFIFEQNKPVKMEWEKLNVLLMHVLEMMVAIIRTDVISSEQKMEDPITPDLFGLQGR